MLVMTVSPCGASESSRDTGSKEAGKASEEYPVHLVKIVPTKSQFSQVSVQRGEYAAMGVGLARAISTVCGVAETRIVVEMPVPDHAFVIHAKMPPGEEPLSAADCYRFALSNPNVDLCMMGPASLQEMEEGIKAIEKGPLSDEEMKRARKIGRHIHG